MNIYQWMAMVNRGGGFPPTYPQEIDYTDLPPAAAGVRPGPAYPSLAGEPTVIVNQPMPPSVNIPGPGAPPANWIYPPAAPMAGYPDLSNASDVTVSAPGEPGVNIPAPPPLPPPSWITGFQTGGVDPGLIDPRAANRAAFALADWNRGMWAGNISDPEIMGPYNLMAKLGMMGRGGGGGRLMAGRFK